MGRTSMALHKLPLELQEKIKNCLLTQEIVNTLTLEEELKLFADELKRFFTEEEIEKIARNSKYVQRKGKLKAWQIVSLCSFYDIDVANATLLKLASKISSNDGPTLSSQAIDQRLNKKCVVFLKEVFNKILKNKISKNIGVQTELDVLFKRIRILDSTAFQLPESFKSVFPGSGGSSQPSGVKIQLEFELKSGEILNVDVGPGSNSDNTFGSKIKDTIEATDLILRDLGYFSFEDFDDIDKRKALYISRLKPNIAVYIKNNNIQYYKNGEPKKSSFFKRIDLKDIMKNMQPGEMFEIPEALIGRDKKLQTRLIIYKLTPEQLAERTEKSEYTAKKKGIVKSENTIELLGITVYITNIPGEVLDSHKIYELYTLRWQVEIIFKTWKSIFHIHNVKPVKIERFQCQLYGKLILLLLASTVMFKMRTALLHKEKKEASEIKLAQIVHEYIGMLYFKLVKSAFEAYGILVKLFNDALKNAGKSHRRDKKTVYDILGIQYNRPCARKEAKKTLKCC